MIIGSAANVLPVDGLLGLSGLAACLVCQCFILPAELGDSTWIDFTVSSDFYSDIECGHKFNKQTPPLNKVAVLTFTVVHILPHSANFSLQGTCVLHIL